MAADPLFIGTVRNSTLKFVNASGTAAQTLFTLTVQTKVTGIIVTSNDTVSRFITVLLGNGSVDSLVDSVRIPAVTSVNPVQRINLFDPNRWTELNYDDPSWDLAVGRVLKFRMESAVSVDCEISVICNHGDLA
jgi:hypothetical protein